LATSYNVFFFFPPQKQDSNTISQKYSKILARSGLMLLRYSPYPDETAHLDEKLTCIKEKNIKL
jgi:hypothetical protein